MNIAGSHRFPAGPERVYGLLLDADALQASMPGCESLTATGESTYDLHMKVPVPAVKGEYLGTVEIVEQEPPNRMRMRIDASGQSGFVKADAVMELTADGTGTLVQYSAEAQLGGRAAAVGQRVLTGISRHQIGQMMRALEGYAERHAGEPTAPAPRRRGGGLWTRLRTWLRSLRQQRAG